MTGDLTAPLSGGVARIFLMYDPAFSINSLCRLFLGTQDYDGADESRNLAWLAIPTGGEAWHHTSHAFPASCRQEADGRQSDLSAEFIELMEKLWVAYDVMRVGPPRRGDKTSNVVG